MASAHDPHAPDARWRMRRAKSNARSDTYAKRSSPPGPSATATTSTPSSDAGATRSHIDGRTPSCAPAVSPTSGKKRGPACCRCPPIPSRPTWCAPSAPERPPYVRFDRNLYSIPHTHVRKPLTLLASATRIRILDGQNELADHHRTYDTGLTVEDPDHLEGLLAAIRQANVHTTRDRLRAAVPSTSTLFERLAERGEALRPHATRLLALLDDYGPEGRRRRYRPPTRRARRRLHHPHPLNPTPAARTQTPAPTHPARPARTA